MVMGTLLIKKMIMKQIMAKTQTIITTFTVLLVLSAFVKDLFSQMIFVGSVAGIRNKSCLRNFPLAGCCFPVRENLGS